MLIYERPGDLADHLQTLPSQTVIGIDGLTGVGKTTLASSLAVALEGSTLDLDAFLDHDRKCFVEALKISDLRSALTSAVRPLFLSGICLREALALVGYTASCHVYVKRMTGWGWADEDELGTDAVPEVDSNSGGAHLRHEMRRYHEKWKPHLVADYEFQRIDG